jgi:hypothetical protein
MGRRPDPAKAKGCHETYEVLYHREQWERTLREGDSATFEFLLSYYADRMHESAETFARISKNCTARLSEIRAAQKAYHQRTGDQTP